MKKKYYAISILLIFLLTIGFTMAEPDKWRGNALFTFVEDTQNSLSTTTNSPAIQGKNATGENQTTVVDQNGNLKMIENKGASSNTMVETPTNSVENGNASSTMNGSSPANTRTQQPTNAVPQTNNQGSANAASIPIPLTGSHINPATPPSSMNPTPTNPVPVNPVPVNPVPVNPVPVNPVPVNPVPVNPVPVNPVPVNPVPVNPAPVNPVPVNPAPVNPAPRMNAPAAIGDAAQQPTQ